MGLISVFKDGNPKRDIEYAVVYYKSDYEFGKFVNGTWEVLDLDTYYWILAEPDKLHFYIELPDNPFKEKSLTHPKKSL